MCRATLKCSIASPTFPDIESVSWASVPQKNGHVTPDGTHAPQEAVQAESHPGQGNVVARVKRGPHPAEVRPGEPAIVRVVQEVHVIVPVHELVLQRWKERGGGDEDHQQWPKRTHPRRAGHRAMTNGGLAFASRLRHFFSRLIVQGGLSQRTVEASLLAGSVPWPRPACPGGRVPRPNWCGRRRRQA